MQAMSSIRSYAYGDVPPAPMNRRGAGTRRVGDGGSSRRRKKTSEHHVPRNSHPTGKLPAMKIAWRDGSEAGRYGQPIQRPLAKGPVESRTQAKVAAENIGRIDKLLRERWNRAGWDDRGGDLTVVVNQKAMGGNAYFASLPNGTGEMGIGTKDPRIGFRKSPAYSTSILFHELVHGIVGSELRGMPAKVQPYLGQRDHSAVNESVADVISTGLLGTKWRNGQEIRDGTPLRDLTEPSIPKWTPAVRKDSGLGEHSLSGILSRAATIAADKAGTLAVVDAWYAAVDRHYRNELLRAPEPGAGRAIGAWVRATMRGAEQVGGANSKLVDAVREGWRQVGLGVYASPVQLAKKGAGAPPRHPR
jgi:Zn-dependent metalloprotease